MEPTVIIEVLNITNNTIANALIDIGLIFLQSSGSGFVYVVQLV